MEDRSRNYAGVQRTVYYYQGNQVGVPSYDFQPGGTETLRVLAGANVHGDHKKPNPNEFAHDRLGNMSGFYSVKYPDGLEQLTDGQGLGSAYSTSRLFNDEVYNQALSKLYDQWRNSSDWSVTALQMRQAGRMFSGAMDIVNYVRTFRIRQLFYLYQEYLRWRRSGGRVASVAANLWLEFQYGWKPLAQDIYNTAVELSKEYPSLMVIEAKAHDTSREVVDKSTFIPQLRERGNATVSWRCHIKCRFKPPASDAQLLSNFTSMNPASIAWELIPFSFCVDWVYNVGGYLRNLETSCLSHCSFVDGFVTEGVMTESETRVVGQATDGGYTYTASMQGFSHRTHKKRSVLLESPFPRPPSFRFDLGATRLLNAAALLSQRFR